MPGMNWGNMFAARISGSNAMDEFDVSLSEDNGVVSRKLTQIKLWLLSHAQQLNFITVLILASVRYLTFKD